MAVLEVIRTLLAVAARDENVTDDTDVVVTTGAKDVVPDDIEGAVLEVGTLLAVAAGDANVTDDTDAAVVQYIFLFA